MTAPDMDVSAFSEEEKRELLRKLLEKKLATKPGPAKPKAARVIPSLQEAPEYQEFMARKASMQDVDVEKVYFNVVDGISNDRAIIDGREFINYSGYNYVGMSGDPAVIEATQKAVAHYGTSVSASRIGSGEKPVHRQLEAELADFIGTEDCVVFVGGYTTNESIIGHLMGPKDLILYDSYIHDSIQRGAQLSGATVRPFPHNRWQAIDRILEDQREQYEKVLIVIEGIYSMDGDMPDLPRFIEVKKRHQAILMVDEAHSLGVVGETGRGVGEYFDVDRNDVDLWMGTLSKTFGSCGGFIAAASEIVWYLKFTTPGFVYSVGLTPADTTAALASLRLLVKEPERTRRLQERAALFLRLAKEQGFDTGNSKNSAVIPLILGSSMRAMKMHHKLFEAGIFALPIIFPVVPENAARLRFFINCTHTEEQIIETMDKIKIAYREI
ncbi:MAG: aminotransferase class I/II-fold pyridoxal phosphate-dependent enzyme, partial [Alphaproteobacteria bacterium]|nr:aminotransferase class I/II-fold pyridoxal phosphate-dependent enzyme [Alphaproteobacteria bacterium]